MITRGIREYVRRDWARVREAKDAYWGERIGRMGAADGFRIAEELRRQARLHDPDWPHPHERQADLETHVRVSALLRRADRARRA
ncbi:MAG: hypothetical protein R2745_24510 [Vicinamibacterales bacterium]